MKLRKAICYSSLSILILISSRNTLADTFRNNIWPNVWAPHVPVTKTHKINHHTQYFPKLLPHQNASLQQCSSGAGGPWVTCLRITWAVLLEMLIQRSVLDPCMSHHLQDHNTYTYESISALLRVGLLLHSCPKNRTESKQVSDLSGYPLMKNSTKLVKIHYKDRISQIWNVVHSIEWMILFFNK